MSGPTSARVRGVGEYAGRRLAAGRVAVSQVNVTAGVQDHGAGDALARRPHRVPGPIPFRVLGMDDGGGVRRTVVDRKGGMDRSGGIDGDRGCIDGERSRSTEVRR